MRWRRRQRKRRHSQSVANGERWNSSSFRGLLRGHTVDIARSSPCPLSTIVCLLQPARLEQILSSVLDRPQERTERRASHLTELRKHAADAKFQRLYDAIENGVADLSDPMLKERVAELKAVRAPT